MPFYLVLILLLLPMSAHAGNFFPSEYKTFQFEEGDLLASKRADGKYAINKVLKIDRVNLKAGDSISIQNKNFVTTEDDFLLIISMSYGASEFDSVEAARKAAQLGKWTIKISHVPNRPPGAAAGQVKIGHTSVVESELEGYKAWQISFQQRKAGVF